MTPGDGTGALNSGSAYVYDLSSPTPTVPFATLNGASPAVEENFGGSVCVSGNTVLVQVDADAAEEHAARADVALVGPRRRIERQERHGVAAGDELRRKRVVAEAASAIHPGGPCGNGEDPHSSRLLVGGRS